MKIVYMGTPEFSKTVLENLHKKYPVSLIVTQPDRQVGRKKEIKFSAVKEFALENNIEIFQPEKLSEEASYILDFNPDVIITCAYGQLVPASIINGPKYGCINVHASLLPLLRGGAPIHKAIINGHEQTGVTIMKMGVKLDDGPIYSQYKVKIDSNDSAGTLHFTLAEVGAFLLLETLPKIFSGLQPTPQNHEEATYAWNITREEERIDFQKTSKQICSQVKGLNPWPVAYTTIDGNIVKIWWAEMHNCPNFLKKHRDASIGEIIGIKEDKIVIKCFESALEIFEIQMAGKKKMEVKALLLGKHPFEKGKKFI